ncbi:hypothetical protein GGI20_005576 [Coemansia sp. BCRC 34301]|nr:hypothetical protein GGI20_005576 [Coemansia sp. BCRC 34301]
MGSSRKTKTGAAPTSRRGASHSKTRGGFAERPRASTASKVGEDDTSYDVFEAEDNDGFAKRRRRHVERVDVRDYEIENIDEDDDEEIDSDDAFNESDEERFSSYKRLGPKNTDDDDDDDDSDDEEEEEEEEEDDLVDLSEMLDASESEEEGEDAAESEDDILSESGSDSASDEEIDEDEDAERLSKLDGFVTAISARAPRRRFVTETGGGYAEDEHAIGSGLGTKGVTLGINDLLGSLGEPGPEEDEGEGGSSQGARQVRALKNQVTRLDRAAKRAGAGVATAPLARRLQDQMDRTVAYEKTKKAVSEWQPAVNANRAAEHLSFPLNQPDRPTQTTASLVSNQGTPTEMEAQIQRVLAQSGMTDEQQRAYEELELQALNPDDVRRRQHELRMMRELMFRSERKAKRMAKIKSKAYRRILKKDKDRAQEKAMERLKEDDPEMHAMLVEKMARSRAEERISLRHKNTSKWAREMAKRSHGDEDAQQALRDQIDQHDALKQDKADVPAKRVRLNDAGQVGQVASGGGHRARIDEPVSIGHVSKSAGSNPWVSADVSVHASRKIGELSKDSTKLDKLSARLRAKRKGGSASAREESVLLDVTNTLTLDKPAAGDSDDGDDSIRLAHAANPNAFSQRELVEQAFAEDNVVEAEFAAEKDFVAEDEAPKDLDVTLPGWGAWGGTGVTPAKNKIIRKAPEGSGVLKQNRLDAKMGEVIINQKPAKSANKYFASNLPFPFYTSQQYEETLQAPLGKEWNTTRSHAKGIKPRTLTKAGRIIDPLALPSKKRQ